MSDKKLTDSEIVKAWQKILKILRNRDILILGNEGIGNLILQIDTTLNEINRLQAENDDFKFLYENLKAEHLETIKAIKHAKAEAYKEFAELLHCYCEGVINQEWNSKVAPISWTIAYGEFEDVIDYQLKEMVGEDK